MGAPVPAGTFAESSEDELLVELETHERVSAWIEARGIAVVEELTRRRESEALAELDQRDPDASSSARNLVISGVRESVEDEVALATGLGQRACHMRVRMAREWERFTPVRQALASGALSWSRALQVATKTQDVDSSRMRGIVEKVLMPYDPRPEGDAGGLEVPQSVFSWRLGRAVAAVTTSRQRHLDAIERRDGWAVIKPDADGVVTFTGHAARITAAFTRVDDIARRLRREGDARSLAQLRSDIGLDLLIDGRLDPTAERPLFDSGLPPARVTVTISAASLLGVNDAAGTVDLRGREEHLPAFVIRQMALSRGSVWRRLVTDPATGAMTDLSTHRYEITGELRDRVQARDRHSRVPGSMRPASRCDTDHDIDFAAGGASSESNVSAKNRRGHNHKTHRRWTSTREPGVNGDITWTAPTGRTHVTRPHDYRDPPPRSTDPGGANGARIRPSAPAANPGSDRGALILAIARNAYRADPQFQERARAEHVAVHGPPITRDDASPGLYHRAPPRPPAGFRADDLTDPTRLGIGTTTPMHATGATAQTSPASAPRPGPAPPPPQSRPAPPTAPARPAPLAQQARPAPPTPWAHMSTLWAPPPRGAGMRPGPT